MKRRGGYTFFGDAVGSTGVGYTFLTPAATTLAFTASTATIANPERGFFTYSETHYAADNSGYVPLDASALATARTTSARSLVFRYFVMEKFLTLDTLSAPWLALVAADLAAIRTAGCKAIIRFAYSTSGSTGSPPYDADPPVARVLSHIAQLAPVLNAAADVIDAVQAGFIGMWGEWYYSDNFGDLGTVSAGQKTDRISVLSALLTGLDSSIFVLVRYVGLKRWATTAGLDGTRIGFHDDALAAPFADYGTYTTFTDLDEAGTRAYAAAQTALGAPMGGESATVNAPDTLFPAVRALFQTYRWKFLNPLYHPDVLASWSDLELAEASRNLGYRIRLTAATLPDTAVSGGTVSVSFTFTNDGYAQPHRARPAQLVFVQGESELVRTLALDIRTITPGTTVVATETVTAPGAGTWAMHLRFPDPAATLQDLPAYAVQLANTSVWDAVTGLNALGHTLTVTGATSPFAVDVDQPTIAIADTAAPGLAVDGAVLTVDTALTAGVTVDGAVLVATV